MNDLEFKKGDCVVLVSNHEFFSVYIGVYPIIERTHDSVLLPLFGPAKVCLKSIRRATPAEITAGHRIDEPSLKNEETASNPLIASSVTEQVVKTDAVREAFEKWFIDTYSKFAANGFAERSAINPDNYRNSTVQWQWEAWKARQAEVDELHARNGELQNNVMVFRDEKTHAISRWTAIAKERDEKQKRIDEALVIIKSKTGWIGKLSEIEKALGGGV